MRTLALALVGALLCACGSTPTPALSSAAPSPASSLATAHPAPEPSTLQTLLRVAQKLNDDFGSGRYAEVYQRWDPQSRALISGGDYVRRHLECPTAPQDPSHVLRAVYGAHGYWLVTYVLDDLRFVDYWRFRAGHWEFDLIRSNPEAVRLYQLSPAAYASAVACNG